MNSVERILTEAGLINTIERPSENDWRFAEQSLGIALPADYRRIVSQLGSGFFGGYLALRNPSASSEDMRLDAAQLKDFALNFDSYREEVLLGMDFYPVVNGLLSIGDAAGAIHLFYLTSLGKAIADKILLLHLDLEEYSIYSGLLSDLIWEVYSTDPKEKMIHELRCAIWPPEDDFDFFLPRPI